MISNAELRARARADLGNNIFKKAWLLPLAIFAFCQLINEIPAATLILIGPVMVGVARCLLYAVRTKETPEFFDMFHGFNDFGSNLLLGLMLTLFVSLWTLLFIVPGIVKGYAYSMAYYIKVDHPEYDWRQCMHKSEEMMKGHKWRLFCLEFSFIGWMLLGLITCGIALFWVTPYMYAAEAEFYEDLKNNRLRPLKESEAVEN